MIRIWDIVQHKANETKMQVTSVYYDVRGMPTQFICKWRTDHVPHMATFLVDEVEQQEAT